METTLSASARNRLDHFDVLRVLAACCIVLLHVSAQNWSEVSVYTGTWQLYNAANGTGRWAVPVFLMISGALFLDPDRPQDIKKLWNVRVRKMLTVFLFWSAFYALESLTRGGSPEEALRSFLKGKYHMWYLLTGAGLYMLTPLIRRITDSREMTRYYLILALCFLILFPGALHLLTCLDIDFLSPYLPELEKFLNDFHFGFGQIYLFYYVLGHYLQRWGLPAVSTVRASLLAAGGWLFTVVLNSWYSRRTGMAGTAFFRLDSLNVLCMSAGLFLLAQNMTQRLPRRLLAVPGRLSRYTMGVYLLHPFVLDRLEYAGLHTLSFHAALSVPLLTVLVIVFSWGLSWVLQRSSFLKKFMV